MRYLVLAKIYKELESTTKGLEKTAILADFLKDVVSEDINDIVILLQGEVFPEWDAREIGIGSKLAIKAIAKATGHTAKEVENKWKRIGDLGEVAEELCSVKKQRTLFQQALTIKKVITNLRKLSELVGSGTVNHKITLLAELLTSANPLSAKYIIRTALEDLRIGVGAGILRDALSKAFDKDKNEIERAYDMITDFGVVAEALKEGKSLKTLKLKVGKPIKVMLYQKVKDIKEGFERVGKPAALEYKYDGFRLLLNRKGDKINLFTRRLDNVSKQFPDVVELVKKNIKSKDYMIDCETIGIDPKTGAWLPFQNISMRIKRKYDIQEMVKKIPIMVNCFDIIYLNSKNLLQEPFKKRRNALEKVIKPVKDKLAVAKQLVTSNEKEAEKFYRASLKKGNEGIMMKNLDAEYKPGSRVGFGVKIKPVMEALDLVIVGGMWGAGKRARWLSSFTLACRDPDSNKYLEVGKVGTGVKEKKDSGVSFGQLTKMLKKYVIEEKGKTVKTKPKIVVEVEYSEIQKSPSYDSGFALRFPRFIRLREDRRPVEADTIKRVRKLYKSQKSRK